MLTATDICNRALDKLGAEPINSIAAPTLINEKRFSRIYPQVKSREIRRRRWRFAFKEASLTALAAQSLAPTPRYKFPLPTDCLRPLRDDYTTWEAHGRELWDTTSGPLYVEYIADVAEDLFPPEFVDVLVCALAVEMAEAVTQNQNKKADVKTDYKEAVALAGRDNAFLVGDEDLHDSDRGFDWIERRL